MPILNTQLHSEIPLAKRLCVRLKDDDIQVYREENCNPNHMPSKLICLLKGEAEILLSSLA